MLGGREHGVPILISEIEPDGLAASSRAVFIGDAILSVNRHNLRESCRELSPGALSSLGRHATD
uniref:PDZ domain-containing protein n=1 Tax=Timema bartmani TaxID=61472 RepID=A0A7R9I520_9NEOP|nr:unnamed protein product [Timema bartmani]